MALNVLVLPYFNVGACIFAISSSDNSAIWNFVFEHISSDVSFILCTTKILYIGNCHRNSIPCVSCAYNFSSITWKLYRMCHYHFHRLLLLFILSRAFSDVNRVKRMSKALRLDVYYEIFTDDIVASKPDENYYECAKHFNELINTKFNVQHFNSSYDFVYIFQPMTVDTSIITHFSRCNFSFSIKIKFIILKSNNCQQWNPFKTPENYFDFLTWISLK